MKQGILSIVSHYIPHYINRTRVPREKFLQTGRVWLNIKSSPSFGFHTEMISLLVKYVEGKLAAETSSVDVVMSLMGTPGFHDFGYLQEVARVLKQGGEFVVQEPAASEEKKVVTDALCWD